MLIMDVNLGKSHFIQEFKRFAVHVKIKVAPLNLHRLDCSGKAPHFFQSPFSGLFIASVLHVSDRFRIEECPCHNSNYFIKQLGTTQLDIPGHFFRLEAKPPAYNNCNIPFTCLIALLKHFNWDEVICVCV